jgi:hypothetical protein
MPANTRICLAVVWLFALVIASSESLSFASTAKLTITQLDPPHGSKVEKRTKIRATVEYSIDGFQKKGTRYILAPYFDQAGPGQVSFNELPRFTDAWVLTKASGTVQITYPITREVASGKLARPVKLHFRILQLTGPHEADSIGEAETVEYELE